MSLSVMAQTWINIIIKIENTGFLHVNKHLKICYSDSPFVKNMSVLGKAGSSSLVLGIGGVYPLVYI